MTTTFGRRPFLLGGLGAMALGSAALAAPTIDDIRARGKLRVVTTASSPPHGFMDPQSGTLKGVMVEVAEAIAKQMGVAAEFTEVPFGGLIAEVTSGRSDLMSAPLFITPPRAEVLDFSAPVYEWGEGLVASSTMTRAVPDLAALSGMTVGVQVSTVQLDMLRQTPGVKEVKTYPDMVTLLGDLRAGRIDVALIDPPSVAYQLKARGLSSMHLVEGYKPVNRWQVGMAVAKGNTGLLAVVNEALAKVKFEGELLRILTKWDIPQTIAA